MRCAAARYLALLSLALGAAGCPSCRPDEVGEGIARLSVRNVGAMVTLVGRDDTCGFQSPAVLGAPRIEGEVGGHGAITWFVDGCVIDAGDGTLVSEDCTGVQTTATGQFVLTASRTIEGTLTGDPANPIVPSDPDAVTITIESAVFDEFEVKKTNSGRSVRMRAGSLSAIARPRLAASATSGACAIATPNVAFEEIIYEHSSVFVTSERRTFETTVFGSAFRAQNGVRGDVENDISGSIEVFDDNIEVRGDGQLDTAYQEDLFALSYACLEDLAEPVSFECIDLAPRIADGAARLTVKTFGTVALLADADATCGFSSAAARAGTVIAGTVGAAGTLTTTIGDCALTFPVDVALPADCTGSSTSVQGTVTVRGTKTVRGALTGNPATPIVPVDDAPATFDLTMTFSDFVVGGGADESALTVRSGALSGSATPRTAVSAETAYCTVSTPNATFEELAWTDGDLVVASPAGTFATRIATSSIDATNGRVGAAANEMSGTLTVGDEDFTVPSDDAGLDPSFTQAAFDATWQCTPQLAQPISFACVGGG